jgi:hypothetical protein
VNRGERVRVGITSVLPAVLNPVRFKPRELELVIDMEPGERGRVCSGIMGGLRDGRVWENLPCLVLACLGLPMRVNSEGGRALPIRGDPSVEDDRGKMKDTSAGFCRVICNEMCGVSFSKEDMMLPMVWPIAGILIWDVGGEYVAGMYTAIDIS